MANYFWLTLLSSAPQRREGRYYAQFRCACGNTVWLQKYNVTRGYTKHCGCKTRREVQAEQELQWFLSNEETAAYAYAARGRIVFVGLALMLREMGKRSIHHGA